MLWWEPIVRLLAAGALGMLTGLEREVQDKPAGLKTFTLVALGAAGFVVVTLGMLHSVEVDTAGADAVRAVSGVATGIGFLGAGAIIQQRRDVHNITTAAGIWVTGAVGVACGAGLYLIAVTLTALLLFTLTVVRLVERRWLRRADDGVNDRPI